MAGSELLCVAVNQILIYPETWDQTAWHSQCGAKHCIAGHGQILAGKPSNSVDCFADAQDAFGLDFHDAVWLFAPERTLREIYSFAQAFRDGHEPELLPLAY